MVPVDCLAVEFLLLNLHEFVSNDLSNRVACAFWLSSAWLVLYYIQTGVAHNL
jgi:hypothetical protein